jgi:hypothetical protein
MSSPDLDNNQFCRTIIESLEISFVHKQHKVDSKGHFKFKTESNPFM